MCRQLDAVFSRIIAVSIAKVLVGKDESLGKIKITETWAKSGEQKRRQPVKYPKVKEKKSSITICVKL